MAFNAGTIQATLSLSIAQFQSALRAATSQLANVANQFKTTFGNAANAMNSANNAANNMKNNMKDLDRIIGGILISQAFYRATNAIQDATAAVVEFSNNMETARISFEYFLGSQDRADGFLRVMQDFAAKTPFSTDQTIQLSRKLMGADFKPEEIRGIMDILNDTAAATGATADQLDRIVLAITQMRTNGRILGGELRQLAEAGIPIYRILQQELGLTAEQMQKIGDLHISGDAGVAALLSGLEKRYKGAGEKVANTMSGMWNTIKDDALIASQKIFEAPYKALEGVVKKIRDFMEEVRNVVQQSGVGGLFEKLVPPELQPYLRIIAGSIMSIAGSFNILRKALGPSVDLLGRALVQALGTVLPAVAAVLRVLSSLVYALTTASPAIQMFIAAIMGIFVANTAAKSLLFLWQVTRMGTIAATIAQAVKILTNAIQALYLTMVRNPIAAVIMVIAGALLYLALSSSTAKRWLDALTNKLASLAGFKPQGIFKPEQNKSIDDWLKQFNKRFDAMNKNIKAVGKNAEEAGKKIKEKFVASFDELFQVPDKLGQVDDEINNIGNDVTDLPTSPDIAVGGPLPPGTSIPGTNDNSWNAPPITPPEYNGGFGGGGGIEPPPNFAPVTAAIETVNSLLAKLKESLATAEEGITVWVGETVGAFQGWVSQTEGAINGWVADTLGAINGWVANTYGAISKWVIDTETLFNGWSPTVEGAITTWVVNTETAIATWATNTWSAINTWATNTETAIATWATNAATSISTWTVNAGTAIATWVINAETAISNWATNTGTTIATWVANAGNALSTWAVNAGNTIATWAVNAGNAISTWAVNTGNAIATWTVNAGNAIATWATNAGIAIATWATNSGNSISTWAINAKNAILTWATNAGTAINTWVVNTQTAISQWVTNTQTNINSWIANVKSNLFAWSTNTKSTITSWVNNTAANIRSWALNAGTNIKIFADNAMSNTAAWVKNTAFNIASWVNATAANVAKWTNNVLQNFGAFANGAAGAIAGWATSSWRNFSTWLSGTAEGVASWAESTLSTIIDWARSAWETLSDLASSVGQAIGGSFSAAANSVRHAFSGMASWAAENKSWLIPVGIAAATVAAGVAAIASGGTALPALAPLLALETGGIVDKEQFVRISEGNKREAVIPLENSNYMRPFSAAVANDLKEMLSDVFTQNQSSQPILYVGTLIADDRSLKELERKMRVIRMNEQARGVF